MQDQSTISFLSTLIEAKEADSIGHCTRVASIAADLAITIGLEPGQVESIRTSAQIHDLGKITIPDEILHKPGRLTNEEFSVIRRHPTVGERLLSAFPELDFARSGVLFHHERWDGHGYPARLGSSDIPLASRIIAIADSFDAMCTNRPYSKARSPREAVHEIVRCASGQFDPDLATAFADAFHSRAQITVVKAVVKAVVKEEGAGRLDSNRFRSTLTSVVATDRLRCIRERKGARNGASNSASNSARRPHNMLEKSAPLVELVVRSLTSFERLILELHYIDRLPCCDISEVLEVTEQQVNQTLADIRARISGVRRTFVEALCETTRPIERETTRPIERETARLIERETARPVELLG